MNEVITMQYNIYGGIPALKFQHLPVKHGCDYIRDADMKPIYRTRDGAQVIANRMAKRSAIPGAVGVVCDCGTHFRVNVAGMPIKNY